jgi:hypothetical protein
MSRTLSYVESACCRSFKELCVAGRLVRAVLMYCQFGLVYQGVLPACAVQSLWLLLPVRI